MDKNVRKSKKASKQLIFRSQTNYCVHKSQTGIDFQSAESNADVSFFSLANQQSAPLFGYFDGKQSARLKQFPLSRPSCVTRSKQRWVNARHLHTPNWRAFWTTRGPGYHCWIPIGTLNITPNSSNRRVSQSALDLWGFAKAPRIEVGICVVLNVRLHVDVSWVNGMYELKTWRWFWVDRNVELSTT